jgi:hypothetical protein
VVAKQSSYSFTPYRSSLGKEIQLFRTGSYSREQMFDAAQSANRTMTWVLRGVGFFLMLLGISLVFRPLAVAADVVPVFGSLLRMGSAVLGFSIALPLTLLTIAVAWLAARPVLGASLLVLGLVALVGFFILGRKRAQAARPA